MSPTVTTPEPADDRQRPPDEVTPPADPSPVPTGDSVSSATPSGTGQPEGLAAAADEGLPEWEPLTPELVEDEAIRGDFVIRWAVVGMALLFGFAPITETRTLVHIRTGEYLAAHGLLPPAKDVFSYTAGDRRWVNLSWMFDLLAAGVHAVAGGIGLSILQGLLAGVAFGLVAHTYRPGIRTWWGSICAALALLACYPQFTVQPELITLVGLGVLLWLVFRDEETGNPRRLWLAVGVVWLWSQFDQRAFLGWMLLLAMAVGEALRKGDDAAPRRALWWRVALAGLAVTAIHPFLWESWLAPIRMFVTDYPALQSAFPRPSPVEIGFYPITLPTFWYSINHDSIAALILFVATAISLVLNRERLHPGHLIAFVVFNLFGGLATHEFAAASLVNCVLCTVNAQSWYRNRFGQVYSVDWRELLFSRGGRAVTVFCFFALAWLVISGRIDGPAGRRTGLGFEEGLQVQMDSYRQIAGGVGENRQLDDRPFHFVARQGDLLIWSGQKTFVDTRAGLFSGNGDNDLLALHDRTRSAMQIKRKNRPGSGEPDVWKTTFEKYQLTHAMPRLSGPNPAPDYITFGDLLSASDWTLTELTASTCVFYRNEKQGPLADYVAQHRYDFVKKAFRPEDKVPETARVCAKPAALSDSLFSVRQPRHPAGIQQAAHAVQLAGANGNIPPQMRAACALLAVRHATAGLRTDSNSADGYRTLGRAYMILDRVETSVMNEARINWFSPLRYYQAAAAFQQAALLSPDDEITRLELLGLFERAQRGELALEAIKQVKRIHPVTKDSPELERNHRDLLVNREFAIEEMQAKIESQVDQQLQNGADRFQVASAAHQMGFVLSAIRTLEDDAIYNAKNPAARNALGTWLIEAGRVQEGMEMLEEASVQGGIPGWRNSLATAMLINGEYNRAIELWQDQVRETNANNTHSALLTLPFVTLNPLWISSDQYPLAQLGAAIEIIGRVRPENATLTFQIGLAQLEQGDAAAATRSLKYVHDNAPNTVLSPLLRFYLEVLTDKKIEIPSSEPPEMEEFEFFGVDLAKPVQPAVKTGEAGSR